MMRVLLYKLAIVSIIGLVLPPAWSAPAEGADKKPSLVGRWRGGMEGMTNIEWEVTDKELIQRVGPQRIETERGAYKVDANAKPARITWGEINRGIWKLEGTRTVCYAITNKEGERPKKFDDAGGTQILWRFTRMP